MEFYSRDWKEERSTRLFRRKYTYKVGMIVIRAIAAWGRFVTMVLAFLALPLFILTAVLRKHKVIGMVLSIGFATHPFYV